MCCVNVKKEWQTAAKHLANSFYHLFSVDISVWQHHGHVVLIERLPGEAAHQPRLAAVREGQGCKETQYKGCRARRARLQRNAVLKAAVREGQGCKETQY
jgi:hypothetical protein